MTVRKLLGLLAATGLLSSLFLAAHPAMADVREPLKVTAKDPKMQKSYPALTGQSSPSRGTGTVNPKTCSEVVKYCDVIRTDIDPQGVKLYSVFATLTYPRARTSPNPGVNLSLIVWSYPVGTDPTVGRQSRTEDCCIHPKVAKVATDEPQAKTFLIIVEAVGGDDPNNLAMTPGEQYNLNVEFVPLDLGQVPTGRRPGSSLGGGPLTKPPASPSARFPSFGSSDNSAPGEASPTSVKVPGADGELTDQELGVLVQAQQGTRNRGVNPIVPIAIAVVVLGLATAGFFFIRARRAPATTEESY